MSEDPQVPQSRDLRSITAFGVLGVLAIASLFLNYRLNTRVESLEQRQLAEEEKLQQKIAAANSRVDEASQSLSQQVGLTQKAMVSKTAELQRQQRIAETRLSEEQQKQQQA